MVALVLNINIQQKYNNLWGKVVLLEDTRRDERYYVLATDNIFRLFVFIIPPPSAADIIRHTDPRVAGRAAKIDSEAGRAQL